MKNSINNNKTKWAFITGAGRRIGASVARHIHASGINIVIHSNSSEKDAKKLESELNGIRKQSSFRVKADLRNVEQLEGIIENVLAKTGRLDVLLNNASTFYPTPLEKVTEEEFDDLFDINVKAPLFLSKAVSSCLKETNGIIINIVDIHSRRPLKNHPVYGSAKAALEMLTRSLAKDLAPEIRVNGISPGAILWPEDGISKEIEKNILRQIPLKRTGTPIDIAQAVLFLIKDAPYITGQIISIDGGRSIGW
ncbi:MAG: pteridine reductase [Pseudomonadota bacterium]|nr:pteridine reductase [Pseudomonadota bacterium]